MTADSRVPVFGELERDPGLAQAPPVPGTGTGWHQVAPAEAGTSLPAPGTSDLVPGGTGVAPAAGTGRLVPGGTGVAPAAGTGRLVPADGLVPAGPVPLARAGTGTLVRLSLQARIARIAEDQRRHRTFWHMLWAALTAEPETMDQNLAYFGSRSWLEPWMTGWVKVFCEWENAAYGAVISRPAKRASRVTVAAVIFACRKAEQVCDRQYRFWIASAAATAFFIWTGTR